MDLQYQLRATCYIHELPEINGKFVRAAGCDLRLLHKEELENLCMTFWGEVWCMGGHWWLVTPLFLGEKLGLELSLHFSIQ